MCKYNPKIDLVFRKLFGSEENKDLLLSFINAVLDREPRIEDLELRNPYNLADYLEGKMSILDIKAVDEEGVWYDIEIQIAEQGAYGKRALYYWSKVYSNQIQKAEDYRDLRKTIGIHLLDFDYFVDQRYLRQVVLKDNETNQLYGELDYQELFFIELSKFDKDLKEARTILDRWITFLDKAYEYDEDTIPEEFKEEEEIVEAVKRLERMYFNEQEKKIYEAKRKWIMDKREELRTAKEKAKKEGIKEGREEGRKKGRAEGRKEGIEKGMEQGERRKAVKIAREMLKDGESIEKIAKYTNLSREEVEELR
ncbi:Rpn family recombination-promoting nuclease/putative transposase [Fuchsiella alkaliacetigena]|uniref:Rpn family recombination-promoting nuclease/putative transposase n=1 Tax=Fuchsiella alkaliacetigena TaxID=957042 RepID=UPI00200A7187|nr:Rpn family recombination-promoting nuclease/putative transposase [Fuchsiella alkaliacetigena]MCK8824318.1 Rpn family recombination-promoting nuclease/putative transposase [Fuchsiella alkaliacetigena]